MIEDMGNQGTLVNRLNEQSRRMRQMEEVVRSLRERTKSLEDQILEQKRITLERGLRLDQEMERLRDNMANLKVDVNSQSSRMRKLVSKREIKEIESYMELVNPLNSAYMTRNEVIRLMDERLEKLQKEVGEINAV